ncbi:MAG TPA: hypothetical protein VKA34_00515 [Balneolales bacterium]|nr:hypothetical protein [Balneolales bacterium]
MAAFSRLRNPQIWEIYCGFDVAQALIANKIPGFAKLFYINPLRTMG